jgi:hypothetical protein
MCQVQSITQVVELVENTSLVEHSAVDTAAGEHQELQLQMEQLELQIQAAAGAVVRLVIRAATADRVLSL